MGGKTSFLLATNLADIEQVNQRGVNYIKTNFPEVRDEHFDNTSRLEQIVQYRDSNISAEGRAAAKKLSAGEKLTPQESAAYQTRPMAESFDSTISMMNASMATISA